MSDVESVNEVQSIEGLLQLFKLFREYKENLGIIPTWLVKKLLALSETDGATMKTAGIEVGQLGKGFWVAGPDLKSAIGSKFSVLGSVVSDSPLAGTTIVAMPAKEGFPPDWQQLANWEIEWAAHYSRCSTKTIRRAISSGELKACRNGKKAVIAAGSVRQWAASQNRAY